MKRTVRPRKAKSTEFDKYDYFQGDKMVLRYVGRPTAVSDPGVTRIFSKPLGSVHDNLCILYYGDVLMGDALEEAKVICEPRPDNFVLPDRFIKPYGETD